VTSGKGAASDWPAKRDALADLSTNSAHTITRAGHEDLVAKQADAAQSIQAIGDRLSAVRTKAPLTKAFERPGHQE
jgi:hypothetical protein